MKQKAGLYFHIPFCRSKCPYCDFYSVIYSKEKAEEYAKRLISEMRCYSGSFDTIYLGGGTPSMLDSDLTGAVLTEARRLFDIDKNSEITIECNPSQDLKDKFKEYEKFGVNRISVGMQSARNEERFALGRRAGQAEVAKTVKDARNAGINNISLDIMLATPKQTLDSLDITFDFVNKIKPAHVSAYLLKIEPGTRFYDIKERLALPSEDETCEMYLKTVKVLSQLGYKQYEISNFAYPGYESRHNLKYWTLADYLGIGKTAHSLWKGERFYYDKNFVKIPDGVGATQEEKIMLGLRLANGIDKALINKDVTPYIKSKLMIERGGKIALTPEGMLVSNRIIAELL